LGIVISVIPADSLQHIYTNELYWILELKKSSKEFSLEILHIILENKSLINVRH
jgi:hypothetical protein